MDEFSHFNSDNVSLAIITNTLYLSEMNFVNYFRNINFTKYYIIS